MSGRRSSGLDPAEGVLSSLTIRLEPTPHAADRRTAAPIAQSSNRRDRRRGNRRPRRGLRRRLGAAIAEWKARDDGTILGHGRKLELVAMNSSSSSGPLSI